MSVSALGVIAGQVLSGRYTTVSVLWRQVSFWLPGACPRSCHRCCHSDTDGTLIARGRRRRGYEPAPTRLLAYSLGDIVTDLGGGPRRQLARTREHVVRNCLLDL